MALLRKVPYFDYRLPRVLLTERERRAVWCEPRLDELDAYDRLVVRRDQEARRRAQGRIKRPPCGGKKRSMK